MNRIVKFITGTFFDFGFVLFCYFVFRLLGVVYNTITPNFNNNIPYTFTFVWIGLLFLTPRLNKKIREINPQIVFNFIMAVIFIGGLSALLTRAAYSLFTNPYKWEIVESNYVGVSGEDEITYENMYGEGTTTEYKHGFVFAKNDSRIKSEVLLNQGEHEDVSLSNYIFWQSALADGFDTKYISAYNCCNKQSDRLELYFTVGPLRIVECFFNALLDTLLFLIIPIIMRFFGRALFFSDFEKFKHYLKIDLYLSK